MSFSLRREEFFQVLESLGGLIISDLLTPRVFLGMELSIGFIGQAALGVALVESHSTFSQLAQ